MMADGKKHAEDRTPTPKPELLGGNIRNKTAPPRGLKPGEKRDDGHSILDELEFVDESPIDLNRNRRS